MLSIVFSLLQTSVTTASGDPPINLAMFYPMIAALAGLLPGALRSFTKDTGFWHTTPGHAIITVLGGAAGVVAQVCSSGHVTKYAFVSAALGAVMAWAMAFKTAGKSGEDPTLEEVSKTPPPPPPGVAVLLPFIFAVVALQACAGCQVQQPSLGQYTQAYEQCLEKEGIKDATNLGAKIFAILTDNSLSKTQMLQQLEALGIPVAGQALELVAVCAVEAWSSYNPIQPNVAPSSGQAAARVFKARHLKTIQDHGMAP